MKIVIDIPESQYEYLAHLVNAGHEPLGYFERVIMRGTPLPKGHGRILDEKDILDTENNDGGWYDLVDMPGYIAGVKAIIEADKEGEE